MKDWIPPEDWLEGWEIFQDKYHQFLSYSEVDVIHSQTCKVVDASLLVWLEVYPSDDVI